MTGTNPPDPGSVRDGSASDEALRRDFHGARRRQSGRMWLVTALLALCTIGHFLTPHDQRAVHEFLFKATYVPIILAALWFGVKGGLTASLATTLLYLLHVRYQLGGFTSNLNPVLDIALYNGIALSTGLLSRAQHRAQRETERLARERAALHEQLESSYQVLREQTRNLLETEEQLRRTNRLTALGELSASLAHEIRNPLSGIRGAAEIVCREDVSQDARAEFTGILQREVGQLNAVVRRFLDFASGRQSGAQSAEVAQVVQRIMELVRKEAQKHSVVVALNLRRPITVKTDRVLLEHILLNLVLNAIQAMPDGGTVTLEGRVSSGDFVMTVRDTGRGILPEAQEDVFAPFYTTRPGGTGLGLAIARRIARGLGGDITLSSAPGEGTEFAVRIPLRPPRVSVSDMFLEKDEAQNDEQEGAAGRRP